MNITVSILLFKEEEEERVKRCNYVCTRSTFSFLISSRLIPPMLDSVQVTNTQSL